MRAILLPLLALVLAGCSTSGPRAIESGSRLATVATLVTMDASQGDAEAVRSIGLTLHLATAPGETPDLQAVRAAVMQTIYRSFHGRDEILLVALADEIAALILEQMHPEMPSDEVVVLVHAGANGAVTGCDIYLAALED